mgnify:CR=1 FL=1
MFLTEDQIILASKGYLKGKFIHTFQKDLLRLKIIKRQLIRFSKTRKINLRLFVNNLILFFNCFDTKICKILLYEYILNEESLSIIKTCLIYINLMLEDEWMEISLNEYIEYQIRLTII